MVKQAKDKKLVGVRVDPVLFKKIKYLSVGKERSIVSLVEEALKDLIKKHKRKT